MIFPITGTAGGDLGLLIEEIVPEIRHAQRDKGFDRCDDCGHYRCDHDNNGYCNECDECQGFEEPA